jgi:hypothetical protein
MESDSATPGMRGHEAANMSILNEKFRFYACCYGTEYCNGTKNARNIFTAFNKYIIIIPLYYCLGQRIKKNHSS